MEETFFNPSGEHHRPKHETPHEPNGWGHTGHQPGHDHDHQPGHDHHHGGHEHGHEPCCFLAGTRLQTPDGLKKVEDLAAGDELCTVQNGVRRLRWVGRSTILSRFADPLMVQPICIEAGALGDGMPARDLWLSPDHAVFLDGLLVQAGALVNGVNIYRAPDMPESFVYYHLELDQHELLLAEGMPAESFVDNVARWAFDNAAEYEATRPAAIEEMPYPRAKSARQVPVALKMRLEALQEQRKVA